MFYIKRRSHRPCKKNTLLRYVGSAEQLFGMKDYTINGGKASGMRAIELYNANGLSFTVLPDRGMDITGLSFQGINLSFLSKTGLTAPQFFTEDKDKGFFKSFFAGFLTTCGLSYMGAPCRDGEENLGLHGVISNTPAYEVCPETLWEESSATLTLSGKLRQAQVFGEHLFMQRRIALAGEENCFTIEDRIENLDFAPVPFMLLYHINFGYPMLSPQCELLLPSLSITPRDKQAEDGLSTSDKMTEPVDGFEEQVFFHKMRPDRHGKVHAMLINHKLLTAVELIYPLAQLPCFTQWKCMKSGEYVLGLEPGNCHVMGRARAKKDGTLQYLQPGQQQTIRIEVKIHHSLKEINRARAAFEA